jgi:hypothetical protein
MTERRQQRVEILWHSFYNKKIDQALQIKERFLFNKLFKDQEHGTFKKI